MSGGSSFCIAQQYNERGRTDVKKQRSLGSNAKGVRVSVRVGEGKSAGCGWRFWHSGFICGGMKSLVSTLLTLICALAAGAQIHTETIEYRDGNTVLEGYLAYDGSIQGKRPGVLIVHQWKGLTDYEMKRAEMLAKLGYNVFALDIYGKGIRPKSPQEYG